MLSLIQRDQLGPLRKACMSCPEIGLQRNCGQMGQKKSRKEVVEEYLAGGVSLRELSRKYGIDHRSIHRWVKADATGGGGEKRLPEAMREMPKDVTRLQRELYEERLRTKLLETMIDIAEGEMGIPIRKKHGAKQ